MDSKKLISLVIGICFVIMSVSGLFLYLGQKKWHGIETIHILFGLIFLGFAIFHVRNNWKSITGYTKDKSNTKWSSELTRPAIILAFVVVGAGLEVQPFKIIAHGGKQLFGPKKVSRDAVYKKEIDSLKNVIQLLEAKQSVE